MNARVLVSYAGLGHWLYKAGKFDLAQGMFMLIQIKTELGDAERTELS